MKFGCVVWTSIPCTHVQSWPRQLQLQPRGRRDTASLWTTYPADCSHSERPRLKYLNTGWVTLEKWPSRFTSSLHSQARVCIHTCAYTNKDICTHTNQKKSIQGKTKPHECKAVSSSTDIHHQVSMQYKSSPLVVLKCHLNWLLGNFPSPIPSPFLSTSLPSSSSFSSLTSVIREQFQGCLDHEQGT